MPRIYLAGDPNPHAEALTPELAEEAAAALRREFPGRAYQTDADAAAGRPARTVAQAAVSGPVPMPPKRKR